MKVEQIGNATLYLGDCREVLPSLSPDAVITDVPYAISQESGGLRELDYGDWDKGDANEVAFAALAMCVKAPSVIAFCEYRQISELYKVFQGRSARTLAWVKSNPTVMNGQHLFLPALEVGYYGKLPGAWFGGNCVPSVWHGPAPTDRQHPTEKPLRLMDWAVSNTVKPGALCVDPFMGSGTTGVACVGLGRRFIGVEIEPKYFDIACKRIDAAQSQGRLFA